MAGGEQQERTLERRQSKRRSDRIDRSGRRNHLGRGDPFIKLGIGRRVFRQSRGKAPQLKRHERLVGFGPADGRGVHGVTVICGAE